MTHGRLWVLLVALGLLPGLAALAVVADRASTSPPPLQRRREPIPLDPAYAPRRAAVRTTAAPAPPPTPVDRRRALGPVAEELRPIFEDETGFQLMPPAKPGDWLFRFPELGETFLEYQAGRPNRPTAARSVLYLQPLVYKGRSFPDEVPRLELLAEYAGLYFGVPAEVLPPLDVAGLKIRQRASDLRQLRTDDILAVLAARVPADAYCLIAVTMEDLYPGPSWNYVFGMASFRDRVGVYSLVRYDPATYGDDAGLGRRGIILRRSVNILTHETGHMFGMTHCPYYRCLMNGSNSLEETDGAPLHLCPVCLHKLAWNVGLDVGARYRRLEGFYRRVGILDEAEWVAARRGQAVLPSTR